LEYAQDGDLSQFDHAEIAEIAGWEGDASAFVEAMSKVGFLDTSPGGYCIHDWGEYAGRLVEDREKKREQDRARSQVYRERQKERHAIVTHDGGVNHAPRVDKSRVDKSRVEEDENREDHPPTPASGGASMMSEQDRRFNEFWAAYPKKAAKKAARKAWDKVKPGADLLQTILEAIRRAVQSDQWKRENGRFIPNPATWINGGCWDDEPATGGDGERRDTDPQSGGDWQNYKGTPKRGFKSLEEQDTATLERGDHRNANT
jgi:hypothetical protein